MAYRTAGLRQKPPTEGLRWLIEDGTERAQVVISSTLWERQRKRPRDARILPTEGRLEPGKGLDVAGQSRERRT